MYLERLERTLPDVRRRIDVARARADRSGDQPITIVGITKGQPLEALQAAAHVGLQVIGENRVQEARQKRETLGDLGLTWHLVGHLQRNKARQALELFELIHSVDSLRLAETLDREAAKLGLLASVLIQVNASGEASKYGLAVEDGLSAVRAISELEHVRIEGLMTMAPFTADIAVLRNTFKATREFYERCREGVTKFEGIHLSMGMSNDFEIAVEEGSTMVRLGTVLFGERIS